MWRKTLAGAPPPAVSEPTEVGEPETPDADQVEQATRDFLIERVATELRGHGFAHLVAHILECMGYTTVVSPPGKDYGVDVRAYQGVLGLDPPLIKVQVKSSLGVIGSPDVTQLLGTLAATGEAGLFVTLGHFSPDAKKLEAERPNLRLIDGTELVTLLLTHYDDLDSRYKSLFPVRTVWARDVVAEGEAPPS